MKTPKRSTGQTGKQASGHERKTASTSSREAPTAKATGKARPAEDHQPHSTSFDAAEAIRLLSEDVARLYDLVASQLLARDPAMSTLDSESMSLAFSTRRAKKLSPEMFEALQRESVTQILSDIRVIGGQATPDFPACCCLGNAAGEWYCSGVLVAPCVVLTAAHVSRDAYRVFLGGYDIKKLAKGEVRFVRGEPIPHPRYSAVNHQHDLMLLFLDQDAKVAPMSLASVTDFSSASTREVALVGFGYNDPVRPIGFGTKRVARVDIDRTADPAALRFDPRSEFVAGRKKLGRDTCKGDSGGPAIISTSDGDRVAGITSRATPSSEFACGDGGIYVRIDAHLDWLRDELFRRGVTLT